MRDVLKNPYPLTGIVEKVNCNGQLGCAKVFDCEAEAEAMLVWYEDGKLICCGGYYNAVWVAYRH